MPKLSMKAAQAVKMPSDIVSFKSVRKGTIATAPGSAQAFESAVVGVTLRFMVEKSCPFYYRIDEVFEKQSNVEPLSHTTIPEQESHDVDWDDEDDVSLPGNLEVIRASDADSDPLTHNANQGPLSLAFELTHDELQLLDPDLLPLPSAAEHDEPILGSAATTTTRTSRYSGTPPSLASSDKPKSILRSDAKGVDKTNNAKRRDFASVYTDASNMRLEVSAKRLKKDLALKKSSSSNQITPPV
ncbi:unnamed protein product [Phytophthora fragariaefolia]|uniref:Unnamed protein product n=1 Tax=Phytophthora fragariaefolia TaxID=1490495 RepID=A0A9W6UEG8_9STRA|nr:unnamed protein product [Phytophthora fragariaefolia]